MIDHVAVVVPAHNEEAEILGRLTALVAAVEAASPCPRCRSSPSPTDAPTAPPASSSASPPGTPSSLL